MTRTLLALSAALFAYAVSAAADTPNVVLICADDIGYGDQGATARRR